MPIKYIWCLIRKTDIIPFLILLLNKAIILETVNILYYLVERLGLASIVEDKIVPIKSDYLTIRNMTYTIY